MPTPNPAETVWTLDSTGAVVSPSVVIGFAVTLNTTLMNNGVVVSYSDTPTIDAAVWVGGDEAALFAPTMTVISATLGTISLAISAAQSSATFEGTYRLQVGVTDGAVRSVAYDGFLVVLPSTGDVVPTIVWCQESDMILRSTAIRSMQTTRQTNDATGFLLQREEATLEWTRRIVKRYNPRPGFILTRQNTVDIISGQDVALPGALAPSKEDLTTALSTFGGIVLEAQLRQIVARYAIALVLRRQATGASSRDFVMEADAQEKMAEDLFNCYQANIVTAAPIGGNTNFLIDADCIILPAGTAP